MNSNIPLKIKYCNSFMKDKIFNILTISQNIFFQYEDLKIQLFASIKQNSQTEMDEKDKDLSYDIIYKQNDETKTITIKDQNDLNLQNELLQNLINLGISFKIEYKITNVIPKVIQNNPLNLFEENVRNIMDNTDMYLYIVKKVFEYGKKSNSMKENLKKKYLIQFFPDLDKDQFNIILDCCEKLYEEQLIKLLDDDKQTIQTDKYKLDNEFDLLIENNSSLSLLEEDFGSSIENYDNNLEIYKSNHIKDSQSHSWKSANCNK